MTKKPLIIIVLMGMITLSVGYVIFRPKEKAASPTAPVAVEHSATEPTPPNSPQNAGEYIDYSVASIKNTTGRKVLFFHAPWCPQCRSIEKGIKEQGVPAGLTIIKVDYDINQALRQQYGVTLQTTFVEIDDSGELIKKYVAYEEPTFDAVKRNFL